MAVFENIFYLVGRRLNSKEQELLPSLLQFASGWDDGMQDHGRPAAITFAADGRMFLADDNLGIIVWIAPTTLKGP